jgi:putative transposase
LFQHGSPTRSRSSIRQPSPRVASIDSQTVKATEVAEDRGYDGGKKITGPKRHILVDSLGLLLVVLVTVANADDGTTAPKVLARLTAEHTRRLEVIWGDTKYHNHALEGWMVAHPAGYRIAVGRTPGRVGGIREVAEAVGGGADIRLAGTVPAAEPGLRAVRRFE